MYTVIFIVAMVVTYTLIDSYKKDNIALVYIYCKTSSLLYKLEPDHYDYHVCHNTMNYK